MPHLQEVRQRISIGVIDLGAIGIFNYFGRESTTMRGDKEVYGGTELGLFANNDCHSVEKVRQYFEIPTYLCELGSQAIQRYREKVKHLGRASIDIIEGTTDSGEDFYDVIDVTPRIGGATPAEVLAISQMSSSDICYAVTKLIYNPSRPIQTGVNFVTTSDLIINAKIKEVEE